MMKINALLESCGSVPSMPRVMASLLSELDQPAPDLERIKRYVSADPGLTCRVLQVACADAHDTSACFDFSAADAVDHLGERSFRLLGKTVAAAATFVVVPGLNMRQFWRVSLNTAKVAQYLATLLKLDQRSAFTIGLIHSVGEVIMQLGMPDESGILNQRIAPFLLGRAKAEEQLFGYSYATVVAEFASRWHFPPSVTRALRYCPTPYMQDNYDPLVGVLHLAAWRARAFEAAFTPAQYASEFPYQVALALGLDIDTVLHQAPVDWHSAESESRPLPC